MLGKRGVMNIENRPEMLYRTFEGRTPVMRCILIEVLQYS
jgi:hypothetical protein